MKYHRLLRSFFVILLAAGSTECRNYHDIMWNSRYFPEILRHTTLKVRLGDQLTIICPKSYHQGVKYEYSKLYWVGQLEWSQCWQHQPKWVGVCGNEDETTSIKMIIREKNPIPGGMEFEVGRIYYIISTSSGELDRIDQEIGGLCEEHQMKLAIWVVGRENVIQTTTVRTTTTKNTSEQMGYEIHEYSHLVSASSIDYTHLVQFVGFYLFIFARQ